MEAAHQIILGGGGGWVNPYQTDDNALVAMWDAAWNVGGGKDQDLNATVWKDLVGNDHLSCDLTIGAWGTNYFQTNSGTNCVGVQSHSDVVYAEFVWRETQNSYHEQNYISAGEGRYGLSRFWYAHYCQGARGLKSTDVAEATKNPAILKSIAMDYVGEKVMLNENEFNVIYKYPNGPTTLGEVVSIVVGGSVPMQTSSIRLYNRALTPDERAANLTEDRIRFSIV